MTKRAEALKKKYLDLNGYLQSLAEGAKERRISPGIVLAAELYGLDLNNLDWEEVDLLLAVERARIEEGLDRLLEDL